MSEEYRLSITGEELEEKLNKIEELEDAILNKSFIQIIRLEEDD